jgi:hypothetical protein
MNIWQIIAIGLFLLFYIGFAFVWPFVVRSWEKRTGTSWEDVEKKLEEMEKDK